MEVVLGAVEEGPEEGSEEGSEEGVPDVDSSCAAGGEDWAAGGELGVDTACAGDVFEGWVGVPGIVLAGAGVLVKGTEGVVAGNRPETGGTGAGGSKIPSS